MNAPPPGSDGEPGLDSRDGRGDPSASSIPSAPGAFPGPLDSLTAPLKAMSERSLAWTVWGLSALVVGLVVVLITSPRFLAVEGLDVSGLPGFHATLNATATLLLIAGWMQIRRKRVGAHRALMAGAFLLSTVFLASYVVYHSQADAVAFGGEGWIRLLYFFILITHVVLAPVILPLALYTLLRALREEFHRHRKIARWTLPLWLYVTVTGVAVYLFMRPYY